MRKRKKGEKKNKKIKKKIQLEHLEVLNPCTVKAWL